MKIGDKVYVQGYVDEIRKDTVIIRNDGGYFGTVPNEVITGELPSAQPEDIARDIATIIENEKDMRVILKNERTETHDLISRQAAISAICNACGKIDCDKMDKCEKLQLPPANCSEFPNNSDTISRQAAIDAIRASTQKYTGFMEMEMYTDDDAVEAIEALPSAQPEHIRINLNEPIKVKLTEWGKEIYYHQYDRVNRIAGREICKPKFPKEDENGYTEFQLWCFIELYGEHMGMTLPNVIEPLEIVYER